MTVVCQSHACKLRLTNTCTRTHARTPVERHYSRWTRVSRLPPWLFFFHLFPCYVLWHRAKFFIILDTVQPSHRVTFVVAACVLLCVATSSFNPRAQSVTVHAALQ